VIVLKPKGIAVVTIEPTPLFRVAVPSEALPLKNWTVPSGTPAVELTPAVSVTGWPTTDGLGEAATVVVVAGNTVCVKTGEVLVSKLVSPWYTAVIEFAPTLSAEEVMLTVPFESSVPVPSEVVPFRNWTVPVGVPEPGLTAVTVAVIVTLAPEFDGLGTTFTAVLEFALATVSGTATDVLPAKFVSPP
jgi:hypothetical protein